MSPAAVPHMEKVYSILRQVHGRRPTDDLNELDVNNAVRGIFMNVTLQAQFILVETMWRIYDLPRIKSWSQRNSYSKWLKSWSWIRQKSVVWPRLIIKNLRGGGRLYCVTKRLRLRMPKPMSSPTRCSVWEVSVTNQSNPGWTKLDGIWKIVISMNWIELMESQWMHYIGHPRRDSKKLWLNLQCEPEQFEGRIIFMSMYNDILWGERGNTEKCETNSVTVANYARRFPLERWSFLGPGSEKRNGTGLILINPMEK